MCGADDLTERVPPDETEHDKNDATREGTAGIVNHAEDVGTINGSVTVRHLMPGETCAVTVIDTVPGSAGVPVSSRQAATDGAFLQRPAAPAPGLRHRSDPGGRRNPQEDDSHCLAPVQRQDWTGVAHRRWSKTVPHSLVRPHSGHRCLVDLSRAWTTGIFVLHVVGKAPR